MEKCKENSLVSAYGESSDLDHCDIVTLISDFLLGTFIYYVSICRGGGGSENANFCLFLNSTKNMLT